MATKSITELEELIDSDGESFLPVDDGIQTFKMKLSNWMKNGQGALAISRTDRNSLVPAVGWEIFNTTQFTKQVWTGSVWLNIGPQVGFSVTSYGATVPPGFLAEDGSAVSRTDYPDLFAEIGTIYGSGDGTTTFNLPNSQRRVQMGKGGTALSGGAPANTLGATNLLATETHTLVSGEVPQHTHTFSGTTGGTGLQIASDAGSGGSGQTVSWNSGHIHNALINVVEPATHTHSFSGTTDATFGSGSHNNVQPSIVVSKFIKF